MTSSKGQKQDLVGKRKTLWIEESQRKKEENHNQKNKRLLVLPIICNVSKMYKKHLNMFSSFTIISNIILKVCSLHCRIK